MLGVYFSGTGNTKYCVTKFVKYFDEKHKAISIETPGIDKIIAKHDIIVFGYPIYFSNIPKIVRDFLTEHKSCFLNKKVFIIATMGLFSGDGTGCSARILKKYGARILGGLHLRMPDCIGDEKILKKSLVKNRDMVKKAELKIYSSVQKLKAGKPDREGLNFFYHLAGLFGQRLWFYGKTMTYKNRPDINRQKCIGCGRCADICPMQNLKIESGKAVANGKCTMCYRCFSHCPTQALTILGKKVYEQCRLENYVEHF